MCKSGDTFEFEDLDPKHIPSKEAKIRIALLAHFAKNKDTAACEKSIFKGDKDADSLSSTFKQISTILDKGFVSMGEEGDILDEDPEADPYDLRFFKTQFPDVVRRLMKNKLFNKKLYQTDDVLSRYVEHRFEKFNIYPTESGKNPFRDGFRKSFSSDVDKFPTIIVCVVGGIMQSEIAQMSLLKEDGGFNLILGGTNVFS